MMTGNSSDVFRRLIEATSNHGEAYFQGLCKQICTVFELKICFVGETKSGDTENVHLISEYGLGDKNTLTQYSLRHTVVEQIYNTGLCYYPNSVQKLFPLDKTLLRFNIESVMGVSLLDVDKKRLGVLLVMHDSEILAANILQDVLRFFGSRTSVELQLQNCLGNIPR